MARPKINGQRKNVVLTKGTQSRLEHIKEEAEFATDADAIRQAIKTYEELMNYQLDGFKIILQDPNGAQMPYTDLHERRIHNRLAMAGS